jgi:hypothetical protein
MHRSGAGVRLWGVEARCCLGGWRGDETGDVWRRTCDTRLIKGVLGLSWCSAGVSGDGGRLMPAGSGQCRDGSEEPEGGEVFFSPRPVVGQCKVVRRAERVACPGMAGYLRRRVGVVTVVSDSRPMRLVQRARLWAMAPKAIHAEFAPKLPDGMWHQPDPSFRSRITNSISAWRLWSASKKMVSLNRWS